jgi:hypothetical protein
MKKIFKNGWWYLLFTFLVPCLVFGLLAAIFKDYHDTSAFVDALVWICLAPVVFNVLLGPTTQPYWRRNASFSSIMAANVCFAIALFGPFGFWCWISLWFWLWFGKVKEPDEKIASFEKRVPDLDLSSSFKPVSVAPVPMREEGTRAAAVGTVVPSRYYARLLESKSAERADDHLYYY